MRPMQLRRSWLFVGAADKNAILTSYDSGADVCIQEFEDFCLPELRRALRRRWSGGFRYSQLSDFRLRPSDEAARCRVLGSLATMVTMVGC